MYNYSLATFELSKFKKKVSLTLKFPGYDIANLFQMCCLRFTLQTISTDVFPLSGMGKLVSNVFLVRIRSKFIMLKFHKFVSE